MKIGTFAFLTAAGMAATCAVVWTTTSPGRAAEPRADAPSGSPTEVVAEGPLAVTPDRSTFQAGGTLMMEGRLGHAVVPAASDTETFLFVEVTADAAARAARPAPLDLAIVLDRSGSMRGQRMKNALDAARMAVRRLRNGDAFSVIAYDRGTEVIIPRTIVGQGDREALLRRLDGVRARGSTCISCGIQVGMNLLGRDEKMVRRILLLSDGEPTAGVRDLDGFRRIAENCQRMGVSVTTVGVDIEYNEQIMAAIARESNGRHFFVQDAAALPPVFDQEMEALTQTVASQAEVAVDLAPGVFLTEVLDRTFRRSGNRVLVPLGTFATGDHKTLLLRLRVPRGPAGERPVASVRLTYDDLAEDKAGTCEGEIVARVTADPSEVAALDGLVSARVIQSETAAAVSEANELFRSGRADEARGRLARQRGVLGARRSEAEESLRKAAPTRMRDADTRFQFAEDVLGAAGTGFEPQAAPAAGEAQIRSNAQDAFHLGK